MVCVAVNEVEGSQRGFLFYTSGLLSLLFNRHFLASLFLSSTSLLHPDSFVAAALASAAAAATDSSRPSFIATSLSLTQSVAGSQVLCLTTVLHRRRQSHRPRTLLPSLLRTSFAPPQQQQQLQQQHPLPLLRSLWMTASVSIATPRTHPPSPLRSSSLRTDTLRSLILQALQVHRLYKEDPWCPG